MAVSQKENSYPWVMAESCSKILKACAGIHPEGPAHGSTQHPCQSLTFQVPLDLLDPMAQVAEKLAQQPGPVTEPSLLGIPQNKQLLGSLRK